MIDQIEVPPQETLTGIPPGNPPKVPEPPGDLPDDAFPEIHTTPPETSARVIRHVDRPHLHSRDMYSMTIAWISTRAVGLDSGLDPMHHHVPFPVPSFSQVCSKAAQAP